MFERPRTATPAVVASAIHGGLRGWGRQAGLLTGSWTPTWGLGDRQSKLALDQGYEVGDGCVLLDGVPQGRPVDHRVVVSPAFFVHCQVPGVT